MQQQLGKVEGLATVGKLGRLLHDPRKYVQAILFRETIHRWTGATKEVQCPTFFGGKMNLLLPSGTDIYLTGGKSHDSELRLARYLIEHLQPADTFVDVGAHYGYFSLLAAELVGKSGKILALEAAPSTYEVLVKNCAPMGQISTTSAAVAEEEQILTFYEFPNLYSEYNTLTVGQYTDQDWYKKHKPKAVEVPAVPLAAFLEKAAARPAIIKIDVEGAEYQVIQGLMPHLMHRSPAIVLEYVSAERGNTAHEKAEQLLIRANYRPHRIDESGSTVPIPSSTAYIKSQQVESDNIVYLREALD